MKPEVNVELKLGGAFEVNKDEKGVGGCEEGLFVCDWANGLVPAPKFIEGVDCDGVVDDIGFCVCRIQWRIR